MLMFVDLCQTILCLTLSLCFVVARMASLHAMADVATRAHCCTNCCVLSTLGYQKGKEIVFNCMRSRDTMDRAEKNNDLRAVIKVCVNFISSVLMLLSCSDDADDAAVHSSRNFVGCVLTYNANFFCRNVL